MKYLPVVIFLIFVLPFIYGKEDKNVREASKTKHLNTLISFLLFYYFIDALRGELSRLINDYNGLLNLLEDDTIFSLTVNISIWGIYSILSFVMAASSILIAFTREKSRILFLRLIPFMWLIEGIHVYQYFLHNYNYPNNTKLFVTILIAIGIPYTALFVLYSNRKFRRIFS